MEFFYISEGVLIPLIDFKIMKGKAHHLRLPGPNGEVRDGGVLPDTFLMELTAVIKDSPLFHVVDGHATIYECAASTVNSSGGVVRYSGIIHKVSVPEDRDSWLALIDAAKAGAQK
jgi:hypothetical protein